MLEVEEGWGEKGGGAEGGSTNRKRRRLRCRTPVKNIITKHPEEQRTPALHSFPRGISLSAAAIKTAGLTGDLEAPSGSYHRNMCHCVVQNLQ